MKIQFKPWDDLEIKAYTAYPTVEQFLEAATAQIPTNAAGLAWFHWGNGVLFRFQPLLAGQSSEVLTSALMKSRLIWETVELAPMPRFESELRMPSRPMLQIRIQDVSGNSFLGPVTEWLRVNLLGARKRTKK
jgi:hypothetical protein